jgi:hypothetical protein
VAKAAVNDCDGGEPSDAQGQAPRAVKRSVVDVPRRSALVDKVVNVRNERKCSIHAEQGGENKLHLPHQPRASPSPYAGNDVPNHSADDAHHCQELWDPVGGIHGVAAGTAEEAAKSERQRP